MTRLRPISQVCLLVVLCAVEAGAATVTTPGATVEGETFTETLTIAAPNVTVRNCVFRGAGVRIRANDATVAGCAISDYPGIAIHVDSDGPYGEDTWLRGAYITGNYIARCNHGIFVEGFDHLIERNEVYRVVNRGLEGDADYARFFGSRITFRWNYFHGTTRKDMSGRDAVFGTKDDAHVDGFQSFINNKPPGTVFRDITLDGNILRSFSQGAHWKALDAGARYANVRVVNNVVLPSLPDEKASRVGFDIYHVDGLIFENNTIVRTEEQAAMLRQHDGVVAARNIIYGCDTSYSVVDSEDVTKRDNIIYLSRVPRWVGMEPEVGGDPKLRNPKHTPADWAEAFGPDAGWRLTADAPFADHGAQIPVMTRRLPAAE